MYRPKNRFKAANRSNNSTNRVFYVLIFIYTGHFFFGGGDILCIYYINKLDNNRPKYFCYFTFYNHTFKLSENKHLMKKKGSY